MAIDPLDTGCPHCGARRGEPCMTGRTVVRRYKSIHAARLKRARGLAYPTETHRSR